MKGCCLSFGRDFGNGTLCAVIGVLVSGVEVLSGIADYKTIRTAAYLFPAIAVHIAASTALHLLDTKISFYGRLSESNRHIVSYTPFFLQYTSALIVNHLQE